MKVLKQIKAVRATPQVVSLGMSMENDVDTIYDMVAHLKEGHGPSRADIPGFKEFVKLVVKKMENMFSVEVDIQDVPGGQPKPKTMYGSEGVQALFEKVRNQMDIDDGKGTLMSDLRKLKQFAFCLPLVDGALIKPWILKVSAIDMARRSAGVKGAIADANNGVDAIAGVDDALLAAASQIVPMASSSAASSSSSGSKLAPPKPLTAKAKEKVAKEQEIQGDILKFFKVGTKCSKVA